MLDFSVPSESDNPERKTAWEVSDFLSGLLDNAIVRKREAETPRNYLGGSRLGHPKAPNQYDRGCERQLYYEYTKAPSERPFDGKLYRIFDMGHDAEKRVAEYLRLAGFDLRTEKEDGKQFGFYTAKDPVTGEARIAGHTDGIIVSGIDGLIYPMLWENKGMNNKKWKEARAKGVERSHPVYYGQMQVYMGFLELSVALFTAINRDTGEIYFEVVNYNQDHAQASLDRGARVIDAKSAINLSRISTDWSHMACKWCPYAGQCRKDEETKPPAQGTFGTVAPEWMK